MRQQRMRCWKIRQSCWQKKIREIIANIRHSSLNSPRSYKLKSHETIPLNSFYGLLHARFVLQKQISETAPDPNTKRNRIANPKQPLICLYVFAVVLCCLCWGRVVPPPHNISGTGRHPTS